MLWGVPMSECSYVGGPYIRGSLYMYRLTFPFVVVFFFKLLACSKYRVVLALSTAEYKCCRCSAGTNDTESYKQVTDIHTHESQYMYSSTHAHRDYNYSLFSYTWGGCKLIHE
jgi:hypothetical protein